MVWLAVALGGALGAMGRFGIAQLMPSVSGEFPWATLVANIIGSALIGFFYVLITEKGVVAEAWRPFIVVGFLGALTTFSTFALDGFILWQNGQLSTAIIYIISSVLACLLCAASAILLTQRLF